MTRYGTMNTDHDINRCKDDACAECYEILSGDHAEYRAQARKTMQAFSDQALEFQSARIVGGIDREECDREMLRRWQSKMELKYDTQ